MGHIIYKERFVIDIESIKTISQVMLPHNKK
jgi:hypothetical protein